MKHRDPIVLRLIVQGPSSVFAYATDEPQEMGIQILRRELARRHGGMVIELRTLDKEDMQALLLT